MNSLHNDDTQTMRRIPSPQVVDPVKDPNRRLKFEAWERGAIVLATAVLAFGGAAGNMVVAIVGALGLLLTIVAMSYMPDRRARQAERNKHPEYEWAEDFGRGSAGIALGVAWALVLAVAGAVLFLFPGDYAMTGGVIAAVLSAVIMFVALLFVDK